MKIGDMKKPDYSSFFYYNPLPSWVYNLDTFQILDVNQAAIDHYGYSKAEFTGLTLKDLRPKSEIPNLKAAHKDLEKQEGNIYFGIFTHQKKSGQIIRMEVNGHKVDFLDRKCMMVVCLDVTEKERQVTLLQESEKRLKAATDIAKLGYWRSEIETQMLTWTDEVYDIWGRQRENFDLTFESYFDTIHPDDREAFEVEQRTALSGKKNLDVIHRIIMPDNSIRWVHGLGRLVKDESGTPIAMEGTVQDITAQKEEEQRLRLLESVITNTRDAILITEAEPIDKPGPRIIYANQAFTKMTGYTAEEVIGKSPRILQGPKSDKAELARMKKAMQNWEPCEITTVNYKKNREEFWINFSISPVADENGWYTHWISIERDVTEQKHKELEKELLRKISQDFNLEGGLITSAKELCETIVDFGSFDLVELWMPNLENTEIQLLAHHAATSNANEFYKWSEDTKSFNFDEGLPGKVWHKKSSLLWKKISEKEDYIRKQAAEKAGINTALGIPLLFNKKVVGVLVIGTRQETKYLKRYVNLFERLEQYIGSEINRKKLENDLQHLYDAIPDIICITDLRGRFLKINKAGCELIGCSEDEILYSSFEKFVHPEDKKASHEDLKKLKKGGKTYGFENRYIAKNGEVIWLSWTSNFNLQEGLIYATARNITSEKRLRELNRQVSKLAKIGSWEIDVQGNRLFWSDMVHQLYETDPKTFEPDLVTAIGFYRKDFQSMVEERVGHCMNTGIPFDFEAVLVTAKKNERWVRAIGNAEIVDGICKRVYGSFQDIHDRKEAEVRLLSLADNLPGVVFQYLLFPDGTDALKYVTKGAEKVWGYSPEAVMENIQLVWDQTKAGGDFEKVRQSILDSIKTQSKWTARYKSVLPNGEIQVHLGTGIPQFMADGTVLYNSVILDITQEAKNEELLEQATGMAHIGSWELDLFNQNGEAMYWSPMTRNLLEVDEDYNPTLTGGFEFYTEESKAKIQNAVKDLIENGKEFDNELLLVTATGKEKWIRCIGKCERVQGKCVRIFGSMQDIHEQKLNEIALQKSLKTLQDYKFSLDQSAIIAVTDKKGVITSVNENFCKISQYTKEELIGNTHQIINSGHHPKSFFVDLWKTIASGKVWRGEVKNAAKDGSYYWVDTTIVPFLDDNNKPLQYLAIRFDVTARKIADEKVIKTLEEKNNILESIGDAFIAVDKNWTINYWNREAVKTVGLKREEVLGTNLWEEYPDAMDLEFGHQYHKAMDTGETVTFEEFYPSMNMWLEVSAYPSREGLSIYFKDVTLRKEADLRLQQANERFQKVTEATNDAIWDWDMVNKTFYRSDAIENFLGKGALKKMKEMDFWKERFHPEDLPEIKKGLEQALQNPDVSRWEMEYRVLNDEGETVYVIDRGLIVRDQEGKPIRMVGTMSDITDQKNFERQLLELNTSLKKYTHELELTNEELEQFAFIASHDLQEPLRMISSFMDQLKRKYGDQLDEKAHQYIHFATDGARRMKQIILDLLDYSRAGKMTDSIEEVDISKLLRDYQLLRRKVIAEKSAEIKVGKMPVVNSYIAPLTQTLNNLLDNALKYTKDDRAPIIDISAEELKDFWKFRIRDNGIGIEPEFFEKIFIIFQRLHNRDKYEGTGIGLSICKKNVESWGGKIWLDSKPGQGTTFYFTLPKTTDKPL